jgi:hypothetical protein
MHEECEQLLAVGQAIPANGSVATWRNSLLIEHNRVNVVPASAALKMVVVLSTKSRRHLLRWGAKGSAVARVSFDHLIHDDRIRKSDALGISPQWLSTPGRSI